MDVHPLSYDQPITVTIHPFSQAIYKTPFMDNDDLFILLTDIKTRPTVPLLDELHVHLLTTPTLRTFVHTFDPYLLSHLLTHTSLFYSALDILILTIDSACARLYTHERMLFLLTEHLYVDNDVRVIVAVHSILQHTGDDGVIDALWQLGFFKMAVALPCAESSELFETVFGKEGAMAYGNDELVRIREMFTDDRVDVVADTCVDHTIVCTNDMASQSTHTDNQSPDMLNTFSVHTGTINHTNQFDANNQSSTCTGTINRTDQFDAVDQSNADNQSSVRTGTVNHTDQFNTTNQSPDILSSFSVHTSTFNHTDQSTTNRQWPVRTGMANHPRHIHAQSNGMTSTPFDVQRRHFPIKTYFRDTPLHTHTPLPRHLYPLTHLHILALLLINIEYFVPFLPVHTLSLLATLNTRVLGDAGITARLACALSPQREQVLAAYIDGRVHVDVAMLVADKKAVLARLADIRRVASAGALLSKFIDDADVMKRIRWCDAFVHYVADRCDHYITVCTAPYARGMGCLSLCGRYRTLLLLARLPATYALSYLIILTDVKKGLAHHTCADLSFIDTYQQAFIAHLRMDHLNYARVLFAADTKVKKRQTENVDKECADRNRDDEYMDEECLEESDSDVRIESEKFMTG